jgi:hypothetical protein
MTAKSSESFASSTAAPWAYSSAFAATSTSPRSATPSPGLQAILAAAIVIFLGNSIGRAGSL